MPPRKINDTFLDKFLAVFGIRRPKKKKKAVSKRKEVKRPNKDVYSENLSINDNFQIVSGEDKVKEIREKRENRTEIKKEKNDDNKNMKNNSKNNTKNKKPQKEKKKRPVLHALLSVFLVIVITCCIVVSAALIYVFAFIDDTVDADLYNLKLEYTSILYAQDKDGNQVELTRLHGQENRLWVDYENIPESIRYAFIACEDQSFETHGGVDWKRTFFGAFNEVFKLRNRQGGSTITQQLVKNITNDDDITAARKIREIMRARYLERHYDKDTIIECYLNTIHLGNGVDGIEVAANYYFDKHASDLTLTQSACLAAITNNPSSNEPYNNPETNKNRRNWVLDQMYQNGFITEKECNEAKEADLGLRKNPSTVLSTTETVEKEEEYNSYFVDAVIEDVIQALVEEKGYTEEYAASQLYKGGYKIYTTVDLDMQNKLESVYENENNFMTVYTKTGEKPQSAMTIMDYEGNVKAIVGGRGKKNGNRVLNRATQSPRPTGSSIKPISVYAPAIEYNIITWGTAIEDSPIDKLENGNTLSEKWPKNYSNTYSYSKTSMLRAIQQSLNTIPVKIVQEMTIDTAYKFVTEKMGLKHFVEFENGQSDKTESSLALGGSVYGATTLEMAAAFSTFGNGGIYYEPKTFTKILDQNDEVVIDNSNKSHRAISEGTSTIMNKLLQTVATNGTGTSARFGNWEIICKTGTTSDNKDRWFVGGTPYYMAACWFGTDNNDSMSGMYMNPAIILWKAAMSSIHEGLDSKEFEVSDKAEFRKYCTTSGHVARSGCSNVAYGYFKSSYTPFCNYHSGYETGEAVDYGYYGAVEYATTSTTTEKTKKDSKTEETKADDKTESGGEGETTKKQDAESNDKTQTALATTQAPAQTTQAKTTKKNN